MPVRHQRKRIKGWQKPNGSVIVDRTSKWGNPYTVEQAKEAGFKAPHKAAVDAFDAFLKGDDWALACDGDVEKSEALREKLLTDIHELKGKDLVCFCPLDKPCHADVLIRLANK